MTFNINMLYNMNERMKSEREKERVCVKGREKERKKRQRAIRHENRVVNARIISESIYRF